MKFDVISLFPEIIDLYCGMSILGKAQENKKLEVITHNPRSFALNKHKKVDDIPYGGGAGMVMQCDPVFQCYESIQKEASFVGILLSPQGDVFNHSLARELSTYNQIIVLAGHYEGFDERISLGLKLREMSIGDFVLTGGELGVLVMIDAISRLIPGIVGNEESVITDSFYNNILKYPQYTRPSDYRGMKVPDILLSGHHKKIEDWRHQQALLNTYRKRPDLLENIALSEEDQQIIKSYFQDSVE